MASGTARPGSHGPLAGLTVVEMAGLGPVPFAAMLLADLGASVTRIDRPQRRAVGHDQRLELVNRGRRSISIDLAVPGGAELALDLIGRSDVVLEGFRPGVMERLGLGPDVCCEANPTLIYARMTGWGRSGPLAQRAGHDIDYIALTGALDAFRRPGESPTAPLNLVGDYAGGGLMLAFGVLSALFERSRSGVGQIVDTSMLDGVAVMTTIVFGEMALGRWHPEGENFLQSAAPWYDTYECADGRWFAVGALEQRFYSELLDVLGLAGADLPPQWDASGWSAAKERFAAVFRTRTRDEWAALFEGRDACGAPVLDFGEVPTHPHHAERGTYVSHEGHIQPAPAPRFSRTPGALGPPPCRPGVHTRQILSELGLSDEKVAELMDRGVVADDFEQSRV